MLHLHLELNHINGDAHRTLALQVLSAQVLCEIRDTARQLRAVLRDHRNFDSVASRKTRSEDVTVHMHRHNLPDHRKEDEDSHSDSDLDGSLPEDMEADYFEICSDGDAHSCTFWSDTFRCNGK